MRKNLKEYSRQFDEEDAAEESNVSAELIAHRKRLVDEWNAWRKRGKEDGEGAGGGARRGKRAEKKKVVEDEEVKEEIEIWMDEVVEQTEEVVEE